MNSLNSIDLIDSTDPLDSPDSPEILVCTHCGWLLTGEEVEMIDDAIAEHGASEKFRVANILCPKCLKRPVLEPLSSVKLAVIMAAGTRLNDTARRLFRKFHEADAAGQTQRARDLYRRYSMFQTRLQGVLSLAKERSMEVQK